MDTKEQDTNQIFEQLKDSLKNISVDNPQPVLNADNSYDTFTVEPYSALSPQTIDQLTSIDLSALNYNNTVVNGGATISVSPSVYTISGAGTNSGPYYTSTGINSPWSKGDNSRDFLTKRYKNTDIAHRLANRLANRIGRCEMMMHVVIFLAKRYKIQISHIDWRIESVDVR